MSNHLHLIVAAVEGHTLPDILRDLKKFMASQVLKAIAKSNHESRKQWMLPIFAMAGAAYPNNTNYQFWQKTNRPIEIAGPGSLRWSTRSGQVLVKCL